MAKQQRRPGGDGTARGGLEATLKNSQINFNSQPFDEVTQLRALVLMQQFAMRSELAAMIAALAFEVRP